VTVSFGQQPLLASELVVYTTSNSSFIRRVGVLDEVTMRRADFLLEDEEVIVGEGEFQRHIFVQHERYEVTHGGCVGTLTFHVPVLTSEVSVVLWDGIRAQPGGITALKLRGVAPVDAAQQASRDLPRFSTAFGRSLVVDDFHPDLISRGLQELVGRAPKKHRNRNATVSSESEGDEEQTVLKLIWEALGDLGFEIDWLEVFYTMLENIGVLATGAATSATVVSQIKPKDYAEAQAKEKERARSMELERAAERASLEDLQLHGRKPSSALKAGLIVTGALTCMAAAAWGVTLLPPPAPPAPPPPPPPPPLPPPASDSGGNRRGSVSGGDPRAQMLAGIASGASRLKKTAGPTVKRGGLGGKVLD